MFCYQCQETLSNKGCTKNGVITKFAVMAGCAKYRYNRLGLGDIGDIPRILDAGQCNDCYSLAYIALQHLGFKNIRIGTTLPAFLSPNVANTLVNSFGLKKTLTPAEDLTNI